MLRGTRIMIFQITWKKETKNIELLVFSFSSINLASWCLLFCFSCGLQHYKFKYMNRKAFGSSFLYWVDFTAFDSSTHQNKSAPLDNISIHYFSSFLQPIEESGWNTLRKKGETHNIYLSHLLLLGVAKYFMHTSEVTYALWRKVINSLGSIWKKNQFQVFLTFIRCSKYFSRYELRTNY